MYLQRTDLSNLTDTVFVLPCFYLIQQLLGFTQMYEKPQKSLKVRAGTKLLTGDVSAWSHEDSIGKYSSIK